MYVLSVSICAFAPRPLRSTPPNHPDTTTGLIKQFLTDVDWGELDFLVIDSKCGHAPPPTSTATDFLSHAPGESQHPNPPHHPQTPKTPTAAPPGTSDEHLSIIQYLKGCAVDGAVVVTTPQEVAMADVRKELNFCRKTGLKVLGVVENMSGLQVPFSALRFAAPGTGEDVTAAVAEALRAAGREDLLGSMVRVFVCWLLVRV